MPAARSHRPDGPAGQAGARDAGSPLAGHGNDMLTWHHARMRHFDFLTAAERGRLFAQPPEEVTLRDEPELVGTALGATLYCPGTRPHLAADIVRRRAEGAQSVVVCLEDAVADPDLAGAERNALTQLHDLARLTAWQRPALFVRVRSPRQIPWLVDGLGSRIDVLAGFVLPKFDEVNGAGWLEQVELARERTDHPLLAMPVLESALIAHVETRVTSLLDTRRLLDKYRALVPAVRVGATDLSGVHGLRRAREFTVWDVRTIGDVLVDIVNVFGRDGAGYPVSGPVWEYFPAPERIFKPQLRETPFTAHHDEALRARLLAADLDGLIREVLLDRANGLVGKTVIHPGHVAAVNALSVVSAEEHADACDILATHAEGGTRASPFGNKMNESKPHAAWARRVLTRSRAYGVAREQVSFVDLLGASLRG